MTTTDLRILSLAEKGDLATKLLKVAPGDELILNGEVWFRIDRSEFKVTPESNPDSDDCYWVPAKIIDIVRAF